MKTSCKTISLTHINQIACMQEMQICSCNSYMHMIFRQNLGSKFWTFASPCPQYFLQPRRPLAYQRNKLNYLRRVWIFSESTLITIVIFSSSNYLLGIEVKNCNCLYLLLPILQEGTKYIIFHSSDFTILCF